MAYFIVRVIVNALALAVTFFLLPGIQVYAWAEGLLPLLSTYLIMGMLFGLINALVRPFILLLTGKLLLWTMGIFTWFVNSFLLIILSLLAPAYWVVSKPVLFWALLAGAIMGITVTILEALVGLDSPLEGEEGQQRFYWRWFSKLPSGRRSRIMENLRVEHVYATMRRYGLDIAVGETPLRNFRHRMQQLIYRDRKVLTGESVPVKVRLMLQELGPTFVKMGQMAASRSDLLPEEWVHELEKLQDEVSPFPYSEVEAIISSELGALPENCFASFSKEPIAAASMAQIHRATLVGGEIVAVKIQRPNIDAKVKSDLSIMADVVKTMEKRSQRVRELGLSGMLNEFARNMIKELDFRNEAFNAEMLRFNMRDFSEIRVPSNYESYGTSKVITMDFIDGTKITNFAASGWGGGEQTRLAQVFIEAMIRQVMIDGFFHADPHPGNLMIDNQTGQIVFLDLGMMGVLSQEQRLIMLDLIWSLNEADSRHVADLVLQLTTPTQPFDLDTFYQEIDRMVKRHLVFGQGTPRLSVIAEDVFDLMFRYHLRLDQALTMAFKALMQAEETVHTLAPELSMFDASVLAVKRVIEEQLEPEIISARLQQQVKRTTKNIILQAPAWQKAAGKWFAQLESGRFSVHLQAEEIADSIGSVEDNLDRNVRRLAGVLLIIGLLVGSAIASNAPLQEYLPSEVALLLFVPFAIATVAALLYLIWLGWEAWKRRN